MIETSLDLYATRTARWVLPFSLVVLAVMTMGNVVPNLFVRDDIGLILGNPLVHAWSGVVRAFNAAYWPPADSGELYRPLTIAWLAVQWHLGGGHALLFRLVSVVLYAVSTLAVWALLRRLVSPVAAWAGAAIFAVHPVHVEAVAEAVSQSELILVSLLCWAAVLHIDANAGRRDVRRTSSAESLIFACALFFKENALVLPGLLLAIDLLVDPGAEGFSARWRRWRNHYGMMVVIAVVFWITRGVVLGTGRGTAPQEALAGGLAARAFTMVGVPAEWLRLLVWPAHLQDEWSLLEWVPTRAWSIRETAGVIATGSMALAALISWRRRPLVAFGLAWMAIALGPVANILIPTGVIIAERTLFLPSVGFVIAIAALLSPLTEAHSPSAQYWRRAGSVALALLLGLGVVRSALRLVDWRTPVIFTVRSIELAPLSWRTHLTYSTILAAAGDSVGARVEARAAIRLRPEEPTVVKIIADNGRRIGGACRSAAAIYEELLLVTPGRSDVRASLLACLAVLGRYEEARQVAHDGIAVGLNADFYKVVERRAIQAIREKTPKGEWRVRFAGGTFTDVGTAVPQK